MKEVEGGERSTAKTVKLSRFCTKARLCMDRLTEHLNFKVTSRAALALPKLISYRASSLSLLRYTDNLESHQWKINWVGGLPRTQGPGMSGTPTRILCSIPALCECYMYPIILPSLVNLPPHICLPMKLIEAVKNTCLFHVLFDSKISATKV